MRPSEFAQHWKTLLEHLNAYVVAPKQTTHRPRDATHRTLDFAVCSSTVEPWIESIAVDEGYHAAPHRAVRIRIRASPRNYLIAGIKRPKPIPKKTPVGCARQPVLPAWSQPATEGGSSKRSEGGYASESTHTHVDQLWPELSHAMETELCRLHGCVDGKGMAATARSGRASGLRVVQRYALPMKASASLGKVSIPAHALAWLAIRVRELAHMSHIVEREQVISANALQQWSAIMDKVTAKTGLPSVVRKISLEWEEKIEFIRAHTPGRDTFGLERIGELAQSAAREIKTKHLEQKAESWKTFVDAQITNGASVAHRLV